MRVEQCLARIDLRDAEVRGWTHLDRTAASGQGPLSGSVLAVKDVIDVAGMPTRHGSPIFVDNVAKCDAEAVAILRAAGAAVLGKTVTAEFATYAPGPTGNPRKPGHTPGGSSSGSAAVVADGQADIALGTQTAGSMIRPASYCGVLAFKPTFGRYPLGGVLETAPSLDTLGLFARNIELLEHADAVLAHDEEQPSPSRPLRVGLCRTPFWTTASDEMQSAVLDFADALAGAGHEIREVDLPPPFFGLNDAQTIIHRFEAARALGHIRRDNPDEISEQFRTLIDQGLADSEEDYAAAVRLRDECRSFLPAIFSSVDLLLTPGAPGAAPDGLHATGDPVFQRSWTAVGAPCLGIPGAWRADGLPLGLQAVAMPGHDRRLLANAKTLTAFATFKEI
ncbi:MAG: amidase [Altererythrobacter sp. XM-24bin4]|uniref:amidase n=1 Tax=uncultured Altererythrobacter sp. TaxID=500840 RepID=UPI000D7B28F9|nr:amidase [uncultured Altererythrobacter sp.]PWL25486.1 MAG: amidase [Altererythrobacter sp. XM-24bin4]